MLNRTPPRRSPRLQPESSSVNVSVTSSTHDRTFDLINMEPTTTETSTVPILSTKVAATPTSSAAAITTSVLSQARPTENTQGNVLPPITLSAADTQDEIKSLRGQVEGLRKQLLEAIQIINSASPPISKNLVPTSGLCKHNTATESSSPATNSINQNPAPPQISQLPHSPYGDPISNVQPEEVMPPNAAQTMPTVQSPHDAAMLSAHMPYVTSPAAAQLSYSVPLLAPQQPNTSPLSTAQSPHDIQIPNQVLPFSATHLPHAVPPFAAQRPTSQSSSALPSYLTQIPKKIYDLPEFNGAPEDWPMFSTAFEHSTAAYRYGNFENCLRLQKALKGEAKECVKSLLIHPDNVSSVMEQLKFQYGRPELLIRCQLQQVREILPISENAVEKLIPFAVKIQNLAAFLQTANGYQHLSNPTLMDELIQKLPISKRMEWAQFASSLQQWPSVLDFSRWLTNVANLLRSIQCFSTNRSSSEQKKKVVLYAADSQRKLYECPQCNGQHKIFECRKFIGMSVPNRWDEVKKRRLCFSCLNGGHSSRDCRRRKDCTIDGCQRKHNKLLHEKINVAKENKGPEPVLNCVSRIQEKGDLLFRVVPVKLYGPNCAVETYALLDEGSSVTMIDSVLVRQLGLCGRESSLNLSWYGGKSTHEYANVVDLHISGLNKTRKFALTNVYGVSNLKLPVQSFKADPNKDYGVPIKSYSNVVPKLLIGLDHCHLGLPDEIVPLNKDGPYASNTALGWIVFGQMSGELSTPHTCLFLAQPEQSLYDLVANYFETENFGVKALPLIESKDDLRARQLLKCSTIKVAGRYQSRLLWCDDDVILPDSYSMSFNRLRGIERKMKKNPEFSAAYRAIMTDYLKKGYVHKLSPKECKNVSPRTWFLPHFGVYNPNKPGKMRLVFDAAATVEGVSLNSKLLKGPQQYKSLPAVLFNFRVGVVAVCGDIKEMFHQILVDPQDRCSQRFLWRENEEQPPDIYEMVVMTFGAACSPCVAQYVKDTNALGFRDRYPRAVKSILDHHYVDDFVDSFDSVSKAIEVSKQVREIHAYAGYELRNFSSNSNDVVMALEGNVENNVSFTKSQIELQSTEKILGMYWHPGDDAFKFELKFHRVKAEVIAGLRYPTKRELLCVVMSVFDPIGFLCNYMISAKLLMREVWRHDVRWDEMLPAAVHDMWNNWRSDLKNVVQVSVPRYYFKDKLPCLLDLHVFVDASEDAFGAVAYCRYVGDDGSIGVSFIAAKTKCAPLKLMTIPRLELQAAVLGTRLMYTIVREHCLKITRIIYWSDSTTVVSWINSESRRYKPFIAHRIAEILDSTRPDDWRWLPTSLNVADETTRMKNTVDFTRDARWFHGPKFLYTPEEDWPVNISVLHDQSPEEELRPKFILLVGKNNIIKFNRFSSFLKLKRTMAWVQRVVKRYHKQNSTSKSLSVRELEEAETILCRLAQEDSFSDEIEAKNNGVTLAKCSDLYTLSPYIDEKKLLRVYGRIAAASWLPLESRHPIILSPSHPLSALIVSHIHKEMKHQNFEATMGAIRERFWIPRLRQLLNKCISNCPFCKIRRALPAQPLMASLPEDRVTPYVRPFSYTGLDYFGPVNITIGRRREKRWVALFTCLTVRAIHMEVAFDLSTDACILAIRNFINRRGTPIRIRSDNGKNFIGVNQVAKQFDEVFDVDLIQNVLSSRGIDWQFNCPLNPSAGGAWERMVQCVKKVLRVTLKEVAPREHTFHSLMIEAENIVNSRPLTHLPISHEDEEPLTPNHFLIGSSNTVQTPAGTTIEKPAVLRKQWRISRQLRDHFWKRWIIEYLPELTRRSKWCKYTKPLAVGDLVLICDPSVSRREWKKGRVEQVYKGADEVIRRADIRTSTGVLKRPVTKLAVLDFDEVNRG